MVTVSHSTEGVVASSFVCTRISVLSLIYPGVILVTVFRSNCWVQFTSYTLIPTCPVGLNCLPPGSRFFNLFWTMYFPVTSSTPLVSAKLSDYIYIFIQCTTVAGAGVGGGGAVRYTRRTCVVSDVHVRGSASTASVTITITPHHGRWTWSNAICQ